MAFRRGVVLLAVAALAASCAGSESAAEPSRPSYSFRPLFAAAAPTHITGAPGERGKLYVVEQAGRIRVAVDGRLRATPFLDIRRLVRSGGEQGLLSVAFHPSYARNRRFFVNYTDLNGHTRVVEYRANTARTRALPRPVKQWLFVRQPYPNHNGGQLAFGPDGRLYVGMGDGGAGGDPENRAQNMNTLLGKLVRIDVSRPRPSPQIAALGLRNPWRFSFDRENGDLWIGDVGQNAWEEIDWLPRSRLGELVNYGWDVYEGRARFENKELSRGTLVQPVHVYATGSVGCSVTGGFVYRGSAVPAARGRYFFGDYCAGSIWSMRLDNGRATDVRREPFRIAGLASFGEDARGELYAASLNGRVYRFAP